MDLNIEHPRFSSAISYRDPKAAFVWLEKAFGFEPYFVISDKEGNLMHSEMKYGDGVVMIGTEWTAQHKSPASIEGRNTQTVHVHLTTDIDAHCERARAAGAVIAMAPETQFYGDRSYRAVDLEGHMWTFSQTVQAMTPEEWDKVGGCITTPRPAGV